MDARVNQTRMRMSMLLQGSQDLYGVVSFVLECDVASGRSLRGYG